MLLYIYNPGSTTGEDGGRGRRVSWRLVGCLAWCVQHDRQRDTVLNSVEGEKGLEGDGLHMHLCTLRRKRSAVKISQAKMNAAIIIVMKSAQWL